MFDTRGPNLSENSDSGADFNPIRNANRDQGGVSSLTPAFLGLGANLGDRESAVLEAARALETSGIGRSIRVSSLYETEPVGCAPMNHFVNAVVQFEPLLCPTDLLKRLQTIEKLSGRSGGHNEPRELDIDIITLGTTMIEERDLVVPHPRYRERAFVLIPLKELAPRFKCPATGRTIDELLDAIAPCPDVSIIGTRKLLYV
jgi:2-amino-4-hydroxy-6-hydroxymethyldihydropteridine diphosphokinase